MWPMSSEKNTTTTTSTTTVVNNESATVAAKSVATTSSSKCQCCCLVTKFIRKLKRRSRTASAIRQAGSFQCRYDPLSYSLNFDTTGCGSLLDEDYYKFYAFSSRFVANPTTSCTVLQVAAGNSH